MAVFGRHVYNEGYSSIPSEIDDVTADSLLEDYNIDPVFEDNLAVAGARICAENTINFNAIMEACSINEYCYFEETGQEYLYEAGGFSSYFEKVKDFFKKLWEKVQSIFKKAILLFNTKAKDDKAFYNKYKNDLNKARATGFGDEEINIYPYVFYTNFSTLKTVFTNDAGNSDGKVKGVLLSDSGDAYINAVGKAAANNDNLTDFIKKIETEYDKTKSEDEEPNKGIKESITQYTEKINESDWKTKIYDEFRANLIKLISNAYKSNECDAASFKSDLAEICQGDTTSKESKSLGTALGWATDYLQNSKDIVKDLDAGLRKWKKSIDDTIRALTRLQREFDKIKEVDGTNKAKAFKHTIVSAAIGVNKEIKNITISFHTGVMTQLKAASGQAKSICVKALSYKKPKNESYVYTEEYSGSLLDYVEMI